VSTQSTVARIADLLAALRLAAWPLAIWSLRLPLGLASRATWTLQAAEAWGVRRRECVRQRTDEREERIL
jgi:hypothetical protein